MTYSVYDCLADTELSRTSSRKEADEIKAIHGSADNCIHVFEVDDTIKESDKKEEKPLSGMLF